MLLGNSFVQAGSKMMGWAGNIATSTANYADLTRHSVADSSGIKNYTAADDVAIAIGYGAAAICLVTAGPTGLAARGFGRALQRLGL